jgi:cytochrome P450
MKMPFGFDSIRGLFRGSASPSRKEPDKCFSLVGASSLTDPYPLYEKARAVNAICFDPADGSWSFLSHECVSWALKSSEIFSNEYSAAFDPFLAGSDGMVHAKTRKALVTGIARFQPSAIAKFTEAWMDRFLAVIRRDPGFDAVWDFGVPLPRDFIAHLLGLSVPEKDRIIEVLGLRRTDMNLALVPVGEILSEIFQEIKASPRDGVCSDLLHSGGPGVLSEEEILVTVRHLWFAGTVTLTGLLPAAILKLCDSPGLHRHLSEHPEKIPAFVSEVLRLEPPAQFVPRMPTEEIATKGVRIPPRSMVRLYLAAANRDPAAFPNPDMLDLERVPYKHLSFGSGEHFCLGALIAKTVSAVSLQRLIMAFPRIQRADSSAALVYDQSPTFRALTSLPVCVS